MAGLLTRHAFSYVIVATLLGIGDLASAELCIVNNTNLLTDVYYQISDGRSPFSLLTWSDVPSVDGDRFVFMEDHEQRIPLYMKGGSWFRDGLWVLRGSEVSGHFVLQLSSSALEILAATDVQESPDSDSPANNYVVASKRPCYRERGDKRKFALWEVIRTGDADEYILQNLGLPGFAYVTMRYGGFYRWMRINHLGYTQLRFKAIGIAR